MVILYKNKDNIVYLLQSVDDLNSISDNNELTKDEKNKILVDFLNGTSTKINSIINELINE